MSHTQTAGNYWREGSQGWLRGRFAALRAWRVTSAGRRKAGWLIGEQTADGQLKYSWSHFGSRVPLDRLVESAHRRHWVEQYHQEAKGLLGWDQYQGRLWPGFHRHAVTVMLAYSFLVWREWQQRQQRTRPGRRRRARSPRPDRRRVSLPEVHRQICDWLRLQAAKELLWREFMTVPERIPA
jgi:SRSO17 transposase